VHATAVTASQSMSAGQHSVLTVASCYNCCTHSLPGPCGLPCSMSSVADFTSEVLMKELGVMWRVSFSSFSLRPSEPAWLLWWDPTPPQTCLALIPSRHTALSVCRVPHGAALSHLLTCPAHCLFSAPVVVYERRRDRCWYRSGTMPTHCTELPLRPNPSQSPSRRIASSMCRLPFKAPNSSLGLIRSIASSMPGCPLAPVPSLLSFQCIAYSIRWLAVTGTHAHALLATDFWWRPSIPVHFRLALWAVTCCHLLPSITACFRLARREGGRPEFHGSLPLFLYPSVCHGCRAIWPPNR